MDNEQEFTRKSLSPQNSSEHPYGHGELAPGRIIDGRYKICGKLGEGGMAVVYLIEQVFLKETFALKVLTTGLSDTATVRFQKEAQVCRLLDHPNLIKVIDFAILENDSPYLVMEYVDGESLADILKRKGQLSEAETIDIFMQIMDGLAYAHGQNVIHRDLKPSNVMLANRPDLQLHVKILDFGIAKMTGQDSLNAMTLTNTGEIFGSPLFMSPEQCMGRTVDLRSDLYSIGCALYQVLTGAPPYSGDSALATMMLHLEGTPLPLKQASLGKEFSPGIEKVTMKLLAKLPIDRYQSARDVYDDLEAIKSRRALKSAPAKPQSVGYKPKASPAVSIMIAVCIGLILASVGVLFFSKKEVSRNVSEPPVEATVDAPTLPDFAPKSMQENPSGQPWYLSFPGKTVGKVAIAGPPAIMTWTSIHKAVNAQGKVSLPVAAPLFFSTDFGNLKAEELHRFRPDEVAQLQLIGSEVTDQTISALPYFKNLQGLFLDNTWNVSNKCIESIANLSNLKCLQLKAPWADMDSVRLGRLVSSIGIETLIFDFVDTPDQICQELAPSKTLVSLRFAKSPVTESGISQIAKIATLENLEVLEDKEFTDACIAKLSALKNLKLILVSQTRISADAIPTLKKFPTGCRLAIDISGWVDTDRERFQKAFPKGVVP